MKAPIQEPRSPPADLGVVAVSCELNRWRGTHIGFLYRRDDHSVWFCDVAWNLISRNIPAPNKDTCWVNVNLRPEILEFIAAALENMDQNAGKIPYDVRYSSGASYFDPRTWSYQTSEPGLTCATFILALFKGFSLDLFDLVAWPSRAEDHHHLESLIDQLEQSGVDPARIAAMRAGHNDIRFRPEEVCGSVSQPVWPIAFPLASELGTQVWTHVLSR